MSMLVPLDGSVRADPVQSARVAYHNDVLATEDYVQPQCARLSSRAHQLIPKQTLIRCMCRQRHVCSGRPSHVAHGMFPVVHDAKHSLQSSCLSLPMPSLIADLVP